MFTAENMLKDPKRKAQMANLMLECLESLQMHKTVKKLKQQANINPHQNLQVELTKIQESTEMTNKEKEKHIENLMEKQFMKLLHENQVKEALEFLNGPMTQYLSNVDKYTTYFIDPPPPKDPALRQMMETYLTGPKHSYLPKYRILTGSFDHQIWFVKSNQTYTIFIDEASNGKIIKSNQVIFQTGKMHDGVITCVRWKNETIFGTASFDKKVKLWNYKLECLRTITSHTENVLSLTFLPKHVASGGDDNFLMLSPDGLERARKTQSTKIKNHRIKDIHYLEYSNQLVTVVSKKNRNLISFLGIEKQQQTRYFNQSQSVKCIQISPVRRLLFTNCGNSQIHIWNLIDLTMLRKLTGHLQQHFIIRMQPGGPYNQYLLTGSENGEIVIYNIHQSEPIAKLPNKSGSVVNGATWSENGEVICACDSGDIEIWVCMGDMQGPEEKEERQIECKKAEEFYMNIFHRNLSHYGLGIVAGRHHNSYH